MHSNLDGVDLLEAPLRFLAWHQFLPRPGEQMSDFWPLMRLFCILFYCTVSGYFMTLYLLYIYENPETILLPDLLMVFILYFVYITIFITIYAMVGHIKEQMQFIHDLNDFTRFGKPPGMEEANRKANLFTYFFYIYGLVGACGFSFQGLLEKSVCERHNVGHARICGFQLPLRVPFSVDSMGSYVFAWLLQAMSLMLLLNSGICVMNYLYSTVELFNAKIAHFKEKLRSLGKRPDLARQQLKHCVEYHVKIIEMCKNLNYCWGSLMLHHQKLVTIIMSLIGIQFLLSWDHNCVVHAAGWLISLSIPCLAGQRLLDEAADISLAAYSSNWFDLDRETRKDLVFILMCANQHLHLDMDGYGPINLSIVGQVVNNIYSILMLLYGTMQET